MQRVIIYDTTLRDGMQGTGISYTLEDKLAIARQLDAFGIDYIEGGFPLSNKKEAEFFRQIREQGLSHVPGWRPSAPPAARTSRRPATRISGPCWRPRPRR